MNWEPQDNVIHLSGREPRRESVPVEAVPSTASRTWPDSLAPGVTASSRPESVTEIFDAMLREMDDTLAQLERFPRG